MSENIDSKIHLLGWRLRMERWKERKRERVMIITKKKELRRKREWMRMLVRTLLRLRLRIGLKSQMKVVRK